ncbi:MAG: hypothetical protein GY941_06130 [Planctomycetes bacterium]|nr:hypothetical protein [Planctomycetota bacterium]
MSNRDLIETAKTTAELFPDLLPATRNLLHNLAAALEAHEWQDISTAPKDGLPIDLWCIEHLSYNKRARRYVNCKWGPVTDWVGNEREDWQGASGEDLEPTHWKHIQPPGDKDDG